MSGEHFDCQEYHISDIADRIDDDIREALAPRPEKVKFHYVSILEECDHNCYVGLHTPKELLNTEEALNYIKRIERAEATPVEGRKDHYQCGPRVYRVTEGDYMDYPDQEWRLELKPETVEFMKKASRHLKIAYIYARELAYMLSGDSGEEELEERCNKEIAKLDAEPIDYTKPEDEDCNY